MLQHRFAWEKAFRQATGLTVGERHMAFTLSTYSNIDGTEIWPSVGTLHDVTGISERHIRRQLRALQAAGWIVHYGTRPNGTKMYRLAIPDLPEGRDVSQGMAQESYAGDTDDTAPWAA